MNERDKFLTEAMGECWHDFTKSYSCIKCGAESATFNDFSTWEGFGKLFTWSQKQDWWEKFRAFNHYRDDFDNYLESRYDIPESLIDPDRFADAVYFMSS